MNLILLLILNPIIGSILSYLAQKNIGLRNSILIVSSCISPIISYLLLQNNYQDQYTILSINTYLNISFSAEIIGLVFSSLVSILWPITMIYGISYMKYNFKNKNNISFFILINLSISIVMSIAFSDNLFTLFVFYEMLSIMTYPLVIYDKNNNNWHHSGKIYIIYLIGSSLLLLLPAISITFAITHSLQFTYGGIFTSENTLNDFNQILLPLMFFIGIAKSALFPLYNWLPKAMVAPIPVSALLHAVAVVKSGIFAIIKISIYIFGLHNLHDIFYPNVLMYLSAITILTASFIAIKQTNIKSILAFSTISNLSYILISCSLYTIHSMKNAIFYMIAHAFAKITLFFCTGNILTITGKKDIREIKGIAYSMPITMTCFVIATLCMIGLPFTAGFWFKFNLLLESYNENNYLIIFVILLSTLLSIKYMAPILYQAYSKNPTDNIISKDANIYMIIPIILTTFIVVFLFFFPNIIINIMSLL